METAARQDRIDELFAQAIELPPDKRDAFLSAAGNGDADLLAEVRKMLAAHERAEESTGFLASTPDDEQPVRNDPATPDPLIGQHIGPYEVKRRLGGGGFGDVYLATRTTEYRQTVAIKVVRDEVHNLPRFELERQLLADLQHEHIARLLDGGTLPDGRPYLIMEYINGRPITQYCDENRLPVKARLALLTQVCKAVAFAHSYSVIHRDIKPGNILVTDQGIVKLLDFGIAKLLDPRSRRQLATAPLALSPDTLIDVETVTFASASSATGETGTAFGLAPMTPAYASPEQFSGQEIRTASDIYSLGVVLYELMTGRRPYAFRQFTLEEMQQVVCDEIPPKPSAIVLEPAHTSSAGGPTGAQKLHKTLKGDLEEIILKTLRKDSRERYQTVEALVDDLSRYDRGHPVAARPIGRSERAVRWVRRNKLVAALVAAVVFALVGGILTSSLFAIDARRQAAAALAAAAQEKKAKDTAVARETETAAVLDFVENKVFAAARPEDQDGGLGHDVQLRQAIEAALPFVENSFYDQPLIEARLRMTLGTSFAYMGDAKTAVQQYENARRLREHHLGPEHPDTFAAMNNLAIAYLRAGRLGEALLLDEKSLAVKRKRLGPDHPRTLDSMNNLAVAYHGAGRFDEAIPLYEQTLAAWRKKLGADHPHTLMSMNNLATVFRESGRLDESIPLNKQTLAARRKKLGPDHPDTLMSMNNLAVTYSDAGRLDESIPLNEQTLAARRKKLGPDHPDTLDSMANLAVDYSDAGRLDESIQLNEQTLAARRKKLGPDHPDTLDSMANLAVDYSDAGRLDESIQLNEQTLAARRKKLGPDHPDTLMSMANLAVDYSDAGRLDEAIQLHEQTLDGRRKKLGADHPDTLDSMANLAVDYSDAGRLDEAIQLHEQTLAARRKKLGADHPDTLNSLNMLAWALATSPIAELRNGKRALKLATEACKITEYKDSNHLDTLAAACAETGDFESAVEWAEKSLELRGDTDAEQLAEMSRALKDYKAKRSTRQEAAPSIEQSSPSEQPTKPAPPDSP